MGIDSADTAPADTGSDIAIAGIGLAEFDLAGEIAGCSLSAVEWVAE